ncbi:MAG: hypothetical protein Ct9H90mP25_4190 [Gammaproteobacteria bacterium]|nr:MAG: hypothetical protein Ct9H90mP25_4190 [Gammaproteobacteria bacterium]
MPIETVQEAVNIPDPQNLPVGEDRGADAGRDGSSITQCDIGCVGRSFIKFPAPTTTDMIIDHLPATITALNHLKQNFLRYNDAIT